jgi:hypothetical protein
VYENGTIRPVEIILRSGGQIKEYDGGSEFN